jgi:hypothetical protein
MSHTAFFGDGEKTFALTPTLIRELERTTGHGIGALFTRISHRDYSFHDILETIRLGLIGGGTSPQEAANLVAVYSTNPLANTATIAISVLSVVMFGPEPTADVQPLDTDMRQAAATGDFAAAIDDALGQVPA